MAARDLIDYLITQQQKLIPQDTFDFKEKLVADAASLPKLGPLPKNQMWNLRGVDDDYRILFPQSELSQIESAGLCSFVGCGADLRVLKDDANSQALRSLRFSFGSQEYDLLTTAKAKFLGTFLFVAGKDYFALQYLTELARDLRIYLIWVVRSRDEWQEVLKTDAPYIMYWTLNQNGNYEDSTLFSLVVPDGVQLWAIVAGKVAKFEPKLYGNCSTFLIVT